MGDLKQPFLNLNTLFFLGVLFLLSALFYQIISPFLIDILLVIILCNSFKRVFLWAKVKVKKRSWAAVIVVLTTLVSFIIPLVFTGVIVLNQSTTYLTSLKQTWPKVQGVLINKWDHLFLANSHLLADFDIHINERLSGLALSSMDVFMDILEKTFVDGSFMIFHFLLILVFMYFIYVDGAQLKSAIHRLIPLSDKHENELFEKVLNVSDAVIFGTVVVGAIEGIYGGLIFFAVGLDAPLVWGLMMCLLSMIPILGANGIMVPAGIITIVLGNVVAGVFVLILGVGGFLVSQNLIKPKLVGNKMGMHEAIVLISTMGGIMWLGLLGFIIGPILAAICLLSWEQLAIKYEDHFHQSNNS